MDDGLPARLGHRHAHQPPRIATRPGQRCRPTMRRRSLHATQATRSGVVRHEHRAAHRKERPGTCASTTSRGMVLMHLKTEAKPNTLRRRHPADEMGAFRSRERSVGLDKGDARNGAHTIRLQTASAASRGHRAAASITSQELRENDAARNVAPPACKRSTDRPPSSKTKTAHTLWAVVLTLRALAPTKQAMPAGANNNSRRRRRSAQRTDWRTQR